MLDVFTVVQCELTGLNGLLVLTCWMLVYSGTKWNGVTLDVQVLTDTDCSLWKRRKLVSSGRSRPKQPSVGVRHSTPTRVSSVVAGDARGFNADVWRHEASIRVFLLTLNVISTCEKICDAFGVNTTLASCSAPQRAEWRVRVRSDWSFWWFSQPSSDRAVPIQYRYRISVWNQPK